MNRVRGAQPPSGDDPCRFCHWSNPNPKDTFRFILLSCLLSARMWWCVMHAQLLIAVDCGVSQYENPHRLYNTKNEWDGKFSLWTIHRDPSHLCSLSAKFTKVAQNISESSSIHPPTVRFTTKAPFRKSFSLALLGNQLKKGYASLCLSNNTLFLELDAPISCVWFLQATGLVALTDSPTGFKGHHSAQGLKFHLNVWLMHIPAFCHGIWIMAHFKIVINPKLLCNLII